MNKEGKYLKKLWCCVGGRGNFAGNLVLTTELTKRNWRVKKADVSSVSPSSER